MDYYWFKFRAGLERLYIPAVYFLIGIAIDFLMGAHRSKYPEEYKFIILTPEDKDKAGDLNLNITQ